MHRWTLLLLLAVCHPGAANVLLVAEDFAGFEGTGLTPGGGGGTLDSRLWALAGFSDGDTGFGDTRLDGDFAHGVSDGGTRSGGLHAFDLPGGLRGVGIQATSSDFTPGALLRRLTNTTSVALFGLRVLLDLWVLNDGGRSTDIRLNASAVLAPLAGRDATPASLLTPATADALGWQQVLHQAVISPLPLFPGDGAVLRLFFDDVAGSGSRDEVAVAGLVVEGIAFPPTTPVPAVAPFSGWLLAPGIAAVLAARRRRLHIVNRPARTPQC